MELVITNPGGVRVEARLGAFTITTDQPEKAGGEGTAPSPFDLFLASLGTCAGYYVASFCRQRELPTEGLRLVQTLERNPETRRLERVAIDIQLPPGFPEKYREALVRAADQCTVKKVLDDPPAIEVSASSRA
jgi:ribosomal protein S12 methylthiotransferase accessory factor